MPHLTLDQQRDFHAALVVAALDIMSAYHRHHAPRDVRDWYAGRITGLEQAAQMVAPDVHAERWHVWASLLSGIVKA